MPKWIMMLTLLVFSTSLSFAQGNMEDLSYETAFDSSHVVIFRINEKWAVSSEMVTSITKFVVLEYGDATLLTQKVKILDESVIWVKGFKNAQMAQNFIAAVEIKRPDFTHMQQLKAIIPITMENLNTLMLSGAWETYVPFMKEVYKL